MARKTKQEALATRDQILDAAECVFQKKGVSQTTLNDIAREAGLTRGAIYWHFQNKVDLFNQMHDRIHLPIQAMAEESARPEESDPLGRFREVLITVLHNTVTDPHLRRVLDILYLRCELVEEMGELVARQATYYTEGVERTARALGNAAQCGQLPADLDNHKAAIALYAYIRGLIINWLAMPDSFDLYRDAESLVDAFFDMLRYSPTLKKAEQ